MEEQAERAGRATTGPWGVKIKAALGGQAMSSKVTCKIHLPCLGLMLLKCFIRHGLQNYYDFNEGSTACHPGRNTLGDVAATQDVGQSFDYFLQST